MPIKQFKAKSSKIEAIFYDGSNFEECEAFAKGCILFLEENWFDFPHTRYQPQTGRCYVGNWFVRETYDSGLRKFYAYGPEYFKEYFEEITDIYKNLKNATYFGSSSS